MALQQYLAIAVIVFCLIALPILSPALRGLAFRLFFGPPRLRIEELPQLVDGHDQFEFNLDPPKKIPGASRSIQVSSQRVSIIYNATNNNLSGLLAETVDISYPGKSGMIATLVCGKLRCLQQIGGYTYEDPRLSRNEEKALEEFMTNLRKLFEDAHPTATSS